MKNFVATFLMLWCPVLIAQPKPETMVISIDGLGPSIYPPTAAGSFNLWALHAAGNRLVKEDNSGQIFGDLADRWQQDSAGLSYDFKLKAQLPNFCDGVALTPTKVVESMRKAFKDSTGSRMAAISNKVKSVELVANDVIRIKLNGPYRRFVREIADPAFSVFKLDQKSDIPCLTGNFSITSFTASELSMVRLADKTPIVFKVMPHVDSIEGLKSGAVSVAVSYSYFQRKAFESVASSLVEFREGKNYFLALNSNSPHFVRREDRQRFSACLNINETKKFLLTNGVFPIEGPFAEKPQSSPSTNSCNELGKIDFVVIAQAGHQMPELSKHLLGKFAHVILLELPKAEFSQRVKTGAYDAFLGGYSILTSDPSAMIRIFDPKSSFNFIKYDSAHLDSILEQIRKTSDLQTIQKNLAELAKLNREESLYVLLGRQQVAFALGSKTYLRNQRGKRNLVQESGFLDLNDLLRDEQ